MKVLIKVAMFCAIGFTLNACSTWDGMTSGQKGLTMGTGAGAVAGAVITDGTILGTAGGAALGAFIGNEVGKSRSK